MQADLDQRAVRGRAPAEDLHAEVRHRVRRAARTARRSPWGPRAGAASGWVMSASGVRRAPKWAKKRSGSAAPDPPALAEEGHELLRGLGVDGCNGWCDGLRAHAAAFNIQTVCMSRCPAKVADSMGRGDRGPSNRAPARAVGGHRRRWWRCAGAVRRARLRGRGHRGDRPPRRRHARRALPPLRGQEGPLPRRARGPRGRAGADDRRARRGEERRAGAARAPACARSSTPAPIARCARIALVDAPSVLGWEEWREIDERYGLGLVEPALRGAMEPARSPQQPVKPLAHLLLGAMGEAGMLIANADRTREATRARGRAGAADRCCSRGCAPGLGQQHDLAELAAGREALVGLLGLGRAGTSRPPARQRRLRRTAAAPRAPPGAWRSPSPRAGGRAGSSHGCARACPSGPAG